MKTLNDKRLAEKQKAKEKYVTENREELKSEENWRKEQARNAYIKNFSNNGDYVLCKRDGTLYWFRYNKEKDNIKLISERAESFLCDTVK